MVYEFIFEVCQSVQVEPFQIIHTPDTPITKQNLENT